MAEIKIEKKKPIWPWIVALLLIGALVYFFFVKEDETQMQDGTTIENTTGADSTNTMSTDSTNTMSVDSTAN